MQRPPDGAAEHLAQLPDVSQQRASPERSMLSLGGEMVGDAHDSAVC
jgi:hypothetical protein